MSVPDSWTIAEAWVIRKKNTDLYVAGKGVNQPLMLTHHAKPRLFVSRNSAKAYIAQWARGFMCIGTDGLPEVVRKDPTRNKLDMEVLPIKLVLEPGYSQDK